jgi:hypothetical protein
MAADHLDQLGTDREDRIESIHRILEDHRDPLAADSREPGPAGRQQFLIIEEDPAGDPRVAGQQADRRQAGHALARAGLPDHGQHLALPQLERHPVDGTLPPVADLEVDRQLLEPEHARRLLDRPGHGDPSPCLVAPSSGSTSSR